MKKKELAAWLDQMSSAIEETELQVGDGLKASDAEVNALRCGLVCGIEAARCLLEYGPYDDTPHGQAIGVIADAIVTYEEVGRK